MDPANLMDMLQLLKVIHFKCHSKSKKEIYVESSGKCFVFRLLKRWSSDHAKDDALEAIRDQMIEKLNTLEDLKVRKVDQVWMKR